MKLTSINLKSISVLQSHVLNLRVPGLQESLTPLKYYVTLCVSTCTCTFGGRKWFIISNRHSEGSVLRQKTKKLEYRNSRLNLLLLKVTWRPSLT